MSSRLRAVRDARGLSREKVARQLGISSKTVERMEKGVTEVKDIHYLAFAHVYEVDIQDLKEEEVAA